MTKILLIGPSGVGKTSALNLLKDDYELIAYDLDQLIKEDLNVDSVSKYFSEYGNENFFTKSKEIIEKIANPKKILIAVGAGSIDYTESHEWYKKQNIITLTGDPKIIYERSDRKEYHQTLDNYLTTEFSKIRKELYANSKIIIDTTSLTKEQVAETIKEIINNYS